MRIVSYNILDGGEGRADPLAEVIEAHRPDIVALIEADNEEVTARIARRMKMDFIVGRGQRHAVAILSRWPIVESINHALSHPKLTGCFLEASMRDEQGVIWIVGAVHLPAGARDSDEAIRSREIKTILDQFSGHRESSPHLLAGDFNANSPVQRIDPANCKPRTREEFIANGNALPRDAVQSLLDAGYVDSFHAIAPAAAETTGSFSTQFPGQRVDYIFTHGFDRARIRGAGVEQDRLAKYASDHFPIYAEII